MDEWIKKLPPDLQDPNAFADFLEGAARAIRNAAQKQSVPNAAQQQQKPGPPSGSSLDAGVRVSILQAATEAARDSDRLARKNQENIRKSMNEAKQGWGWKVFEAGQMVVSTVAGAGGGQGANAAKMVNSFVATYSRSPGDPKIGPVVDPLFEAWSRMPEPLQAYLRQAAEKLPAVPNESSIQPQASIFGIRLSVEAKKRGYWPIPANQAPDGEVLLDIVRQQLEAWGRVAQEVLG